MLRFMTLGTKINKKYRNFSVLITEQVSCWMLLFVHRENCRKHYPPFLWMCASNKSIVLKLHGTFKTLFQIQPLIFRYEVIVCAWCTCDWMLSLFASDKLWVTRSIIVLQIWKKKLIRFLVLISDLVSNNWIGYVWHLRPHVTTEFLQTAIYLACRNMKTYVVRTQLMINYMYI